MAAVGVVISSSWDELQWLVVLADQLHDDGDTLIYLDYRRQNTREHYLWFVACALARVPCARVVSVEQMIADSDHMVFLGPKQDRRLRRIRKAAKRAGVDYTWRTRPRRTKPKIKRRETIGRAGF